MKNFTCLFFRKNCISVLMILLFSSQIIFSQTWVRKIDGFSMWSIGKDLAGNIYAGTTGTARGIFKSTDGGETWTNMFSTGLSNYLDLACDSLNNVYAANVSNGLLKSTDGGLTFTVIPSTTFNGNSVNSVACGKNGHIFVGATNGGIWRSTDYGATFTNTALQTYTIVTISVDKFNSDIIYAGASSTALNGFFRSTDGGLTFGTSTNPLNIWQILQTNSNVLYVATTSSPYPFTKSTDGGLTWTTPGNQPGAMRGATLDLLEDIYISGNGGVQKSTDGGATFANHNLTFSSNKIIAFENKIMVCVTGTTNGGVWIFTDTTIAVEFISFTANVNKGNVELNWSTATEENNSGFAVERKTINGSFEQIAFIKGNGTTTNISEYHYVDNTGPGSYLYRLKQIDYDGKYSYSKEISVEVTTPEAFILEQNYPNPFNPVTTIEFSIPEYEQNVKLIIYNALGEKIKELINEVLQPGFYKYHLDAGGLANGIYIYQLTADKFILAKKMILLK